MKIGLLLFSLLLSVPADSNTGRDFLPGQKAFVRELFDSGDYFNCIAEARRLQYYSNSPETEYFIYTCYYLAGQYVSVVKGYRFDSSDRMSSFPPVLLVSQSWLKMGRYGESYSSLGPPLYDGFDVQHKFTFFLRRVEPLVLGGDYNAVEREILAAQDELEGCGDFLKLRRDLEAFRENESISPLTGGIMSAVVPGLGQLWSGRFTDALFSLASVVLPAAGGIYLKNEGNTGTAYTMFFFSGLFYAGNIYGGYNSAALKLEGDRRLNHKQITERYGKYDPVIYVKFGSIFN